MNALTEAHDLLQNQENQWQSEFAGNSFALALGVILSQQASVDKVFLVLQRFQAAHLFHLETWASVGSSFLEQLLQDLPHAQKKIKNLQVFVQNVWQQFGDWQHLQKLSDESLREFLLSIPGIGLETCDLILSIAFQRAVFAVNVATHRILLRHRLIAADADYFAVQDYCHSQLPENVEVFLRLHAGFLRVAHDYCKKSEPLCSQCPLQNLNGGPVFTL